MVHYGTYIFLSTGAATNISLYIIVKKNYTCLLTCFAHFHFCFAFFHFYPAWPAPVSSQERFLILNAVYAERTRNLPQTKTVVRHLTVYVRRRSVVVANAIVHRPPTVYVMGERTIAMVICGQTVYVWPLKTIMLTVIVIHNGTVYAPI